MIAKEDIDKAVADKDPNIWLHSLALNLLAERDEAIRKMEAYRQEAIRLADILDDGKNIQRSAADVDAVARIGEK